MTETWHTYGLMSVIPFQKLESSRIQHPYSGFERIPIHLTRFELLNYFSFSEKDRALIFKARGSDNQIGLALLLGGIRLTGRFIQDFRLLPMRILHHVCEQLDIPKPSLWHPSKRRTHRHHAEYIHDLEG